jgi:hypothetical protein
LAVVVDATKLGHNLGRVGWGVLLATDLVPAVHADEQPEAPAVGKERLS